MIVHKYGKGLRHIRKKLGLTLIEMSEKIDISKSQISEMELGRKNIGLATIEKYAKLLKIRSSSVLLILENES